MLKHLGAVGFARGLYAVSQAVLLILLARDVGPQTFGVMAAFVAAHTFVFLLAGMNTPTFVTRETALGDVSAAVASIRANTRVMAVAIVTALTSSLVLLGTPLLMAAVAGNAIALWSDRMTDNRLAIAYGERRIGTPATTLALRAALPLALYLALTQWGVAALLSFAVARAVAGLASQGIGVLLIRLPRGTAAMPARDVLIAQVPLATTTAMGAIRTLDSVVVIALAGAATSGVYSAVSRIVSPFNTLAVAAAPVLIPRAAVADSRTVRRMLDGLLVIGLVLSGATILLLPFTELLVVTVFGPEFSGGGAVLLWVLLRVGPVAAAPLMSTALQAKGLDRMAALNSLVTSVLTLAAVAIGAILGGAAGAAGGYAIVGLAGMIALWITGRRSLSHESPAVASTYV